MRYQAVFFILWLVSQAGLVVGRSSEMTVDMGMRTKTDDLLWGLFFEEINHAGEGGLYAEMVADRSFDWMEHVTPPGGEGRFVSFQNLANNELFIRHCNFDLWTSRIDSDLAQQDGTFNMVPALNGGGENRVSFEAFNFPGRFVQVTNAGALQLSASVDPNAASFEIVEGLSDSTKVSIVSLSDGPFGGAYVAINSQNTSPQCGTQLDMQFDPSPEDATWDETQPLKGGDWFEVGDASFELETANPINPTNVNYMRVDAHESNAGLINHGYWGINLQSGSSYDISLFARSNSLDEIVFFLETLEGETLLNVTFDGLNQNWQKFEATVTAPSTDPQALLTIRAPTAGTFFIDQVSIFPHENSQLGHPFRMDLLEKLIAMKPRFLRFPGGCYVEGDVLANRFNWETTVVPVEERPGHFNDVWGYWSTDGLGYFEYLLLSEMIGASPVFVFNAGVAHNDFIPPDSLGDVVQSALDSIEFSNGDTSTHFGKIRAEMGHPEPFNMHMLGVGNENCFQLDWYAPNYLILFTSLKDSYPEMEFFANCDLSDRRYPMDMWEYHIYSSQQDLINRRTFWDTYPNQNDPVFLSEFAVTSDAGTGNLGAAVSEAAYMTGIERNSHLVKLACYAPLFVNTNDRTWNPDAIVFNSFESYGTPSYWVQHMFSTNQGSVILGTSEDDGSVAASAMCETDNCSTVVLKLVNFSTQEVDFDVHLQNTSDTLESTVSQVILGGESTNTENSFADPLRVSPTEGEITACNHRSCEFVLKAHSVNIFRLELTA